MNVWNKVFLGAIIVLAVAVLVLGAVDLKVRSTGQKTRESLETKIQKTETDAEKIKDGTSPKKTTTEKSDAELSFDELKSRLSVKLAERGRAWFGCKVSQAKDSIKLKVLPPTKIEGAEVPTKELNPLKQVEVRLVVTRPTVGEGEQAAVAVPDAMKGVVYVFAENNANNNNGKGKFLGRFIVNSAPSPTKYLDASGAEKNAYQVMLLSIDSINAAEMKAIDEAADLDWTVLLMPPSDQEADPEKRRDWAVALDYAYKERDSIGRKLDAAKSAIETLETAEKQSLAENEKMEADIALEHKRTEAMEQNREAVKKTLEEYNAEINEMNLKIEKVQALLEAYVAEIADSQLKAKAKIEQDVKAATNGSQSRQ
ncbi:hypothetical protein FACS189454_05140 [Planctomycetales bacterium]|nr:hypothetical protein FACS189454_05140 [Planctomycetales bacterium]